MLTLILITLALILVPMFRVSGPFEYSYSEAKNQLLILLMGGLLVGMLFVSSSIPAFTHDPPSLLFFLFCLYLTLTCTWSDLPKNSLADIPRWWALFLFFHFSRQVPSNLLLHATFIPAVLMALYGLIQKIFKVDPLDKGYHEYIKKDLEIGDKPDAWNRFDAWLGNPNYVGAYLTAPFFIGLHFTVTISYWYLIPTAIVLLAIGYTHCRAAQLGCVIGLLFVLYLTSFYYLLDTSFFAVFTFFVATIYSPWRSGLKAAWHGRSHYYHNGWEFIKKNPLFGNSPRVYRRKAFRIQAYRKPKGEYQLGKRMHQEYLETLVEAGVIGLSLLALFLGFFVYKALPYPFLTGALISVLVDALFFYPFRSAACSLPFFAVVGVVVGPVSSMWVVAPVTVILTILTTIYLTYLHSIKPFIANACFETSMRQEDPQKARQYINQSLLRDNTRNMFLGQAAEIFMKIDTTVASSYAHRCMEHFDGEKIEWSFYTRCAEIFAADGALFQARSVLMLALHLNPGYEPAKKDLEKIEGVIKELKSNDPSSVDDTPPPDA